MTHTLRHVIFHLERNNVLPLGFYGASIIPEWGRDLEVALELVLFVLAVGPRRPDWSSRGIEWADKQVKAAIHLSVSEEEGRRRDEKREAGDWAPADSWWDPASSIHSWALSLPFGNTASQPHKGTRATPVQLSAISSPPLPLLPQIRQPMLHFETLVSSAES